MHRLFFLTGGFISLTVGLIGIILPIIPTTPFLLLSGFCFAKSSTRFEAWLRKTKVYQFYVADYAETKSISAERKKKNHLANLSPDGDFHLAGPPHLD